MKFRGTLPWVETFSTNVRVPLESVRKMAIESCPRFETYTNRPFGCTRTSAVELLPENPAGSVEAVAPSFSSPACDS